VDTGSIGTAGASIGMILLGLAALPPVAALFGPRRRRRSQA